MYQVFRNFLAILVHPVQLFRIEHFALYSEATMGDLKTFVSLCCNEKEQDVNIMLSVVHWKPTLMQIYQNVSTKNITRAITSVYTRVSTDLRKY